MSDAPEETDDQSSSGRIGPAWLPGALVGLATVLATLSVLSTWVRVQALDTDAWVSLSEQLLAEPEVQSALATYLVDETYREIDVSAEVSSALPGDLQGLSGLIAASLKEPATTGVERLIASNEFQAGWAEVNRAAHEALVAILRDDVGEGLSTADGVVTLDLGVLLEDAALNIGLPEEAIEQFPADAGQVTILESDELESAQAAVGLLDFMSWFSFLLVVALYAAAVYVAGDRRRVVLRNVGLSLVAAGVFVLTVRSIAVQALIDGIAEDPETQPWIAVVGHVVTGLIRQMAWTAVFCGVIISAFASLLGDYGWSTAVRRVLAPFLNLSDVAVAVGTAVIILLLLWWSPGRVFDRWVTGLTVVVLIIGAVAALARKTRAEFGTVTFDELVGGSREAVT